MGTETSDEELNHNPQMLHVFKGCWAIPHNANTLLRKPRIHIGILPSDLVMGQDSPLILLLHHIRISCDISIMVCFVLFCFVWFVCLLVRLTSHLWFPYQMVKLPSTFTCAILKQLDYIPRSGIGVYIPIIRNPILMVG